MTLFKIFSTTIIGLAAVAGQMWAVWASRPDMFLAFLAVNTASIFITYGGIDRRLLVMNTAAQATFGVAAAIIGGWGGIAALFITGGLVTLLTWKSGTSAEAL